MRTSVIIPTYNHGRFLREAIDSVRSQTVEDLEIIVIDDGSTDDTPQILASMDEPRLSFHRTKNRGLSAARSEGLRRARGQFIAFLDADDRWRPEKLERQLAMMESEPDLGAVFTNLVQFDGQNVSSVDQFEHFPELARVPSAPAKAGHGRRVLTNGFATFVLFAEFPTWIQPYCSVQPPSTVCNFRSGRPTTRAGDSAGATIRIFACARTRELQWATSKHPSWKCGGTETI